MPSTLSRPFVIVLACAALVAGSASAAPPAAAAVTPSSTVSTVAGTGAATSTGDGGPAVAATLAEPRGQIATGPDGSLYVADTMGNRIRRMAPDGTISTVAGTGVHGYGGDGGPATAARLGWPHDVTVDGAGNVWIADSANHRIRVVSTDGIIRTVVGTGVGGFDGDGRPGVQTRLNRPKAVLLTGTHLLFSDGDNHRVRRLDLATQRVSTVAGTGVAGASGDGGPATRARLQGPRMLALADDGTLYIADSRNHRIRRVGTNGVITTVAGTGVAGFSGDGGPATRARLRMARGVAVADGVLYIADTENSRLRTVDLATGVIRTLAGTGSRSFGGDGGPAAAARLNRPRGVTVLADGRVVFPDTMNHRIRALAPS